MNDVIFQNHLPIQLRFNDIDAIGHVNNSVYFNFFDLGKTAYFEEVRGEHIDWKTAQIVIRSIHADFLAPTFYREKISVETAVTKIGNKSLQIFQKIIETQSGVVKATCQTVMVGFDPETNQSKVIAEEWKQAIRIYEKNSEL